MVKARVIVLSLMGAAFATSASAHVSLSGPTTAGTSQVLTVGVGHGCEGADTVGVEISIPEEVMSVRALVGPDGFGEPVLTRNDADAVTKVSWSKNSSRDMDELYYSFGLRIGVPDMPFETLYFPATQTCMTADGEEITVEWDVESTEHEEGENPAPSITIMPMHYAGWNKYTVKEAIEDLSVFDDAQIVWSGDAAYSSNPETASMIEDEEDVDTLTEIEADAEIWVKY